MADQHDKETDPITSGNRMTKDEIAGRDPQNHAEVPEKSKDEKESKHPDQEADKSSEEASSEEAPDLSHASDEDGDVQPSDEDNQQDKE
ncbi:MULTISPECIES: hypothetical protein [Exiguobacterium]|uniref:hypothetical protein n=1 Tax=Exiguobacterium TaxID=33986 RepID=UPI000681F3FF|nr:MULTISPECIES: hypothetical protein [Exiguobacterium]KNH34149.1 hypothetical protein ACS74_10510 [Exiguobacterium acetylicum]